MEVARGRLGEPSNGVARDGVNLLMYACQHGHEAEVRQILATKPGAARERDRAKKTALHYCAENSSLNCIDQVLNAEPSLINATDDEGYTPLHLAVISGNRAVVRFLVNKGADLRCLDNEKHSLVHWATVCGELECLSTLVEAGADASTADIHSAFPVHYAAQMCGPNSELGNDVRTGLQALRRLLEHGVNVNVKDQDGRQPLLWAASAGSSDAILALVNAGASISSQDKDGLTALHCAASRGHNECLETLYTLCGTELDAVDNNGCTALFYAVTLGHADCTEVMLKFGSEPNRQDRKGRTPAHCGAAKGQLETLKILAKHEGNLWMKNIRGDLPLHEAVHSGRKDLVKWLLDQKPEAVNAANNDGRTPLHVAALNSNVEMCKVLMDNRAFINPVMRNSKGQLMTPLDAALYRGRGSCAKYLQLSGAVPASKLNERIGRGMSELGSGSSEQPLGGHATGNSTDRDSLTLSENITRFLERSVHPADPIEHNHSHHNGHSSGSPQDHKASQADMFKDSLRDQGSQTLAGILNSGGANSNNNNNDDDDVIGVPPLDDPHPIEGAPLTRSYAHPHLHGGLRHHGPTTGKAVYQQRQLNQQAPPAGGRNNNNHHEQRLPPSENVSPVSGDTFTTHKDSGISHSDRGDYSDLDSDNAYSLEGGRAGRRARGGGGDGGGSDPAVNTTTTSSENNTLTRRRRHRTSRHAPGMVGRRGVSDSEFDRRRPRKLEGADVSDGIGSLPGGITASSADAISSTVQNNVKRYQRERRIFHVLLELKRQQIRGGKSSELTVVKRLADNYIKEGLTVNHQKFQGPYTYRAFDNYLYEQLRFLSTSGAGSAKFQKNETNKNEVNLSHSRDKSDEHPSTCTNRTFNCHHAAHAYTGIPCAAFIKPKVQSYSFLPQIFPAGKDGHTFNVRDLNPNEQVTLEIKQAGKEKKAFSLPTDALDKNKRYQVTFTIGNPPAPTSFGGESNKHTEKLKALVRTDTTKIK